MVKLILHVLLVSAKRLVVLDSFFVTVRTQIGNISKPKIFDCSLTIFLFIQVRDHLQLLRRLGLLLGRFSQQNVASSPSSLLVLT